MNEPLHIMLANASLNHKKRCRQHFQEYNLSEGQPKVLINLLHHQGILQKDLAALCCVEPATMTSLLQKMVQDNLIEKRQLSVSGGKRAYGIYLTETGEAIAANVKHIMDDAEELAFQNFSGEEKELFLSLLSRMSDNLA